MSPELIFLKFCLCSISFLALGENGIHKKYRLMGKWYHVIKPKPVDTANFQLTIWKAFLALVSISFWFHFWLFLEEMKYSILISRLRKLCALI